MFPPVLLRTVGGIDSFVQNKLEAQYAAKRDAHLSEVQDLKQQLEIRTSEVRTLNATIDSLKSVNDELKACTFCRLTRSLTLTELL